MNRGSGNYPASYDRRSGRSPLPPHRPHIPYRPSWDCRVCHEPWPCQPAQLLLLMEYRRDAVALSVYMAGMLHDATGDFIRLHPNPGPNPAELFDRFLAWTRPEPRSQPS